ncbi:MAG: TetR/AcrR family transcriptional regulator [Moraxellaceae bacterium]|nr:MAG: TetR/AcrR family transcriptional regulator [Moraxellaceae bacterium]
MTEGKIKLENRIYAGIDLTTRKAERKMRFIEAGIKIIGTNGYRSATLRVLCSEAGLTERYFYESFCSTEALFLAVLDHLTLSFKTRLETLIQFHLQGMVALSARTPDQTSQTDLARLALSLYFTEVRNPHFGRITLIEVLGLSPTVDQKYIENTRAFSTLVTQIVRAIEPDICIDAQDEEIVGTALVGSIVTTATGWMLQGYPYSIEQMVNNCLQILTGTARQLISASSQNSVITVANTATSKQANAI